MWLGLFYFSVGNLLIKKKQSKEDIWPTTPQKVWQSFWAFHHNKWAVLTLCKIIGISKTGGNLELPKPLRKAKGGSNGFSNPEPLELQNSNFLQTALPRACKVRRGADTWYTIARPTATTSQQGTGLGTWEPLSPRGWGPSPWKCSGIFLHQQRQGSFCDIKQTQRMHLFIDGNPAKDRFASTLIPSQMGGV